MLSPNKTNRKLREGSEAKNGSSSKKVSGLGGVSNTSIMDAAAAAVGNMRRTK